MQARPTLSCYHRISLRPKAETRWPHITSITVEKSICFWGAVNKETQFFFLSLVLAFCQHCAAMSISMLPTCLNYSVITHTVCVCNTTCSVVPATGTLAVDPLILLGFLFHPWLHHILLILERNGSWGFRSLNQSLELFVFFLDRS